MLSFSTAEKISCVHCSPQLIDGTCKAEKASTLKQGNQQWKLTAVSLMKKTFCRKVLICELQDTDRDTETDKMQMSHSWCLLYTKILTFRGSERHQKGFVCGNCFKKIAGLVDLGVDIFTLSSNKVLNLLMY